MAQFLFSFEPMDLKQLNNQYFLRKDMYQTVLNGLSSNLVSYRNGIMYLEVTIGEKWKRSYDFTAYQLAYDWRNSFSTLENAIGCKVFIIDLRNDRKTIRTASTGGSRRPYTAKKGILFRPDQLN
jgi:hypothetical protein